jgi:hypothetical protein
MHELKQQISLLMTQCLELYKKNACLETAVLELKAQISAHA